MIKNAMSATLVALLSTQQAEARDFDIKNELQKAFSGLISTPKKAAIDSLKQVLAAAPDDDEADAVIDLNFLDANAEPTQVTSSNIVEFKVHENPTTGYTWFVDSSNCGPRLKQTNAEYTAPPEGLIGAHGERVWTFETPSANENYIRGLECDMKFYEYRSWEQHNDAVPDKTVRIIVN